MRDTRKFNLIIGNSALLRLTKRDLAYSVFAEAVKRGVSPEYLGSMILSEKTNPVVSVEGIFKEQEFIQKARQAFTTRGRSFDPIRYFTSSSKLLYVKNRTYAFTNQWGQKTIPLVDSMIREMKATDVRYVPCS